MGLRTKNWRIIGRFAHFPGERRLGRGLSAVIPAPERSEGVGDLWGDRCRRHWGVRVGGDTRKDTPRHDVAPLIRPLPPAASGRAGVRNAAGGPHRGSLTQNGQTLPRLVFCRFGRDDAGWLRGAQPGPLLSRWVCSRAKARGSFEGDLLPVSAR